MASAGNKRRVLVLVQNLPVPFDRRVWLESTTLQRNGYDVSVICPKMKGYNTSRETLEGIDIYRYAMPFDPTSRWGFVGENLWAWLRTLLLTVRVAVRGKGFDVIHACNPPETFWTLGGFWKLFGKRFLFDHHDLSPELYEVKFGGGQGSLLGRLLRFLERATFATADVAIATNASHKRVAVERGRMSPDDVFIVRSGPDVARFTEYQADPSWKHGQSHLIAFLGEMGEQDGVDLMIDALAQLVAEGRDDFHCVFIGGGTNRNTLIEHAAARGIADRCTFTGVVSDDDLCRILSSADIGIDPVPQNAWSNKSTMNKIMEYMFFGLPIVAFDLDEARVSAQDAAVYANPNEVADMAKRIEELLDDPERRATMSAYGKRRLRQELAWEHSAPHLLAAYDRVFS
ncbi:MAG TPA: glycosyltransferase family 4 protein [Acidimicrobiia bacterium]|nr:glycosyltransferase family 4 protein [Acidimicrobiia bacterium]